MLTQQERVGEGHARPEWLGRDEVRDSSWLSASHSVRAARGPGTGRAIVMPMATDTPWGGGLKGGLLGGGSCL